MAAHGGAWKVAYADFVTAMMAFFLVMWIVGQDQKIKRAVAHYFKHPISTSQFGDSTKPSRSGSLSDSENPGDVPKSESISMGLGRNSYTSSSESSRITKLVSDWILTNPETNEYWLEQANQQRQAARQSKKSGAKTVEIDRDATLLLARQMKDEFTREVYSHSNGLHQDLLFNSVSKVNWTEIAEDLLSP